jgi:hypothetical protein
VLLGTISFVLSWEGNPTRVATLGTVVDSKPSLVREEDLVCAFCAGYWTVSWSEMKWEGPPAESVAVMVRDWRPVGVPGSK